MEVCELEAWVTGVEGGGKGSISSVGVGDGSIGGDIVGTGGVGERGMSSLIDIEDTVETVEGVLVKVTSDLSGDSTGVTTMVREQ